MLMGVCAGIVVELPRPHVPYFLSQPANNSIETVMTMMVYPYRKVTLGTFKTLQTVSL